MRGESDTGSESESERVDKGHGEKEGKWQRLAVQTGKQNPLSAQALAPSATRRAFVYVFTAPHIGATPLTRMETGRNSGHGCEAESRGAASQATHIRSLGAVVMAIMRMGVVEGGEVMARLWAA